MSAAGRARPVRPGNRGAVLRDPRGLAGWRQTRRCRNICVSRADGIQASPAREVGGVDESGRGGTQQRETIVATNETSTTPEVGATTGMAKWKGGTSTRSAPPAGGGPVYGLGMIGALVYFLGTAKSGQDYVLAIGKATVWPALLVYRAFKVLGG